MTVRLRPDEEHLAYAPERFSDYRPTAEPIGWPTWDDGEEVA